MEMILNNPGFVHLAEIIFGNLNFEKLDICKQINESSRQILDRLLNDAMFLIRQFKRLSKQNQEDWIKVIQLEKNSDKEKAIISYLKWKLKNGWRMSDLPCYENPEVQQKFKKRIQEISRISTTECPRYSSYLETVKILAPLTDNPNAPDESDDNGDGFTPIHWAVINGHTEIVKILALLTDNPNAPCKNDMFWMCGMTPIYYAAKLGNTEIIKFLIPLTDNPNAPDEDGKTPVYWAALFGFTETVKILAASTENPNAPDEWGGTPIYWAANRGHTEIVKILAPLTNHPNAPNEDGDTPIHHAASMGHTEIVKILAPLTDNPNAPNNSGETPSSVAENSEIRRFLESYNPSGKSKTEPSTMPSNKRAKKF